jgi:hypothetical protein
LKPQLDQITGGLRTLFDDSVSSAAYFFDGTCGHGATGSIICVERLRNLGRPSRNKSTVKLLFCERLGIWEVSS